ncbi:MAG: cytochrome C oxidase subunit IV family protein [Albidovulum sp.]|uniref:cytochrome C oxidase subunit IV family protein n=1 Tax=Albidovulum sp. TaxID=1872424 RepID=UPI003C995753
MTNTVTRAWALLLALSAASTGLAVAVTGGHLTGAALSATGAAILILAWVKARLILNAYLRLNEAPAFQRGFGLTLALYAGLLLVLYLVA